MVMPGLFEKLRRPRSTPCFAGFLCKSPDFANLMQFNVKQPGFRAQKSIADDDVAMPGKERGRVALVPRSSTTPGASNFGWRADRAFNVS
jgi:hypothetical protein